MQRARRDGEKSGTHVFSKPKNASRLWAELFVRASMLTLICGLAIIGLKSVLGKGG